MVMPFLNERRWLLLLGEGAVVVEEASAGTAPTREDDQYGMPSRFFLPPTPVVCVSECAI